jgi:hypothetical protein
MIGDRGATGKAPTPAPAHTSDSRLFHVDRGRAGSLGGGSRSGARHAAAFAVAGHLRRVDRVYLVTGRVTLAGGRDALAAGEIAFAPAATGRYVTEVTNQFTGCCPDPDSWPAVLCALDRLGVPHPGTFTDDVIFRRCPQPAASATSCGMATSPAPSPTARWCRASAWPPGTTARPRIGARPGRLLGGSSYEAGCYAAPSRFWVIPHGSWARRGWPGSVPGPSTDLPGCRTVDPDLTGSAVVPIGRAGTGSAGPSAP